MYRTKILTAPISNWQLKLPEFAPDLKKKKTTKQNTTTKPMAVEPLHTAFQSSELKADVASSSHAT